jgi:hypothetical protein
MPRNEAEDLLIMPHAGLLALFKGKGQPHDWAKVATSINMTRCIAEQPGVTNGAVAIKATDLAQNVMLDVRKRAMAGQPWKVRPKEIGAIHTVLALYEDLLGTVSYLQYNAAVDLVTTRLRELADNDTARRAA